MDELESKFNNVTQKLDKTNNTVNEMYVLVQKLCEKKDGKDGKDVKKDKDDKKDDKKDNNNQNN